MNPATHTRLVVAFAVVTALLGVGSYADLIPDAYTWGFGVFTAILGLARRVIVGVGDAMDDGQLNGSFDPEAGGKRPGARNDITRPLVVLAALLGLLSLLSACEMLKRVAVPLAQLGLEVAAQREVIRPGDRVLIGQGLAYIAEENATTRDKVVRLSELGLAAAVERGALKPGDVLIIEAAGAIIERAIEPEVKTAGSEPEGPLWEREGGLLNP